MAGVKISQLPLVLSAQLTDLLPAVQTGVTSGETLNQIYTLFQIQAGFVGGILKPVSGGTGVSSPIAHTIPIAEGSSNFSFIGPLTDGQLLIGVTGADPIPGQLSAGTGISIANAPGMITISGTASSIGWTEVTTTSMAMVADNGYVANNAGLVTLTLPVTAAFGTEISVIGKGAGGWLIAQNANQQIHIGSSASTLGNTGSVASSNQFDSLRLICTTANLIWTILGGPQGNLTIV